MLASPSRQAHRISLRYFLDGTVTGVLSDEVQGDAGIGMIHASGQPSREKGSRVVVCLRPEHIRISTSSPAERPVNCFDGKLVPTAVLGDRIDHVVGTGECELRVRSEVSVRIRRADDVFIWAQPSDVIILDR